MVSLSDESFERFINMPVETVCNILNSLSDAEIRECISGEISSPYEISLLPVELLEFHGLVQNLNPEEVCEYVLKINSCNFVDSDDLSDDERAQINIANIKNIDLQQCFDGALSQTYSGRNATIILMSSLVAYYIAGSDGRIDLMKNLIIAFFLTYVYYIIKYYLPNYIVKIKSSGVEVTPEIEEAVRYANECVLEDIIIPGKEMIKLIELVVSKSYSFGL